MQKSPNENDGSSHGDTYLIFLISILACVIIPFSLLPLPDLSTIDLITRRLRQPIATPSTVPWTRRHRHRTLPTRRSSSSKGGRQEQHRRMDHRWSLQEGQRGRRARQPIMDKDRQRHHQDEDPLSRWKTIYIYYYGLKIGQRLQRSFAEAPHSCCQRWNRNRPFTRRARIGSSFLNTIWSLGTCDWYGVPSLLTTLTNY